MKRLPPIRHKLNVEKPNVIKFKFNHAAKFIYKIKFDHLQTRALWKSPLWLPSKYSLKCMPLVKLIFPQQTPCTKRKVFTKSRRQCLAQHQKKREKKKKRGSVLQRILTG